jgi:hypothetical protein
LEQVIISHKFIFHWTALWNCLPWNSSQIV